MNYAVHICNNLPSQEHGLTPNVIISQNLESSFNSLKQTHVWGCPTYLLEPKLQDSRKLPKRSPQAKHGQFLGFSPEHSTQIRLIRNLRTGSITPQYHVVFENLFTTLTNKSPDGTTQEQQIVNWKEIIHANSEQFGDIEDVNKENNLTIPPTLHNAWKDNPLPSQTTPCPRHTPLQTEEDRFGQDILSRSPGLPPSILRRNSYKPQLLRNLQHKFSQEETPPIQS